MKTLKIPQATAKGYAEVKVGGVFDWSYPTSKTRRGRVQGEYGEIAPALNCSTTEIYYLESMVIKASTHPTGRKLEFKGEKSLRDLSPCLRATDYKNPSCVWQLKEETNMENLNEQNFRIRKLTPRECFRLMGVDEKNIDKIQAAGISNSQQYKLAGNSIVVDVMENIFEQLFYPEEEILTLIP